MIIEHHAKCSITEADILEAAKSWKHRCPDCNRGFHTKSSMYTHQNLQCQMPATEKHWTVDKVVDTCTCLNGRHYRVKWTGLDDKGDPWPDTWEPSFRFCDESKTAKLAKEVSFTDGPTTIRPNNYCGAPDDIEVTPSTQAPTTPCLARTGPRLTTKSGDRTATEAVRDDWRKPPTAPLRGGPAASPHARAGSGNAPSVPPGGRRSAAETPTPAGANAKWPSPFKGRAARP